MTTIEGTAVAQRTVTIDAPSKEAILLDVRAVVEEAECLIGCVDSQSLYDDASRVVARLKGASNHLDEKRKERTRPLDSLKATLIGDYAPAIDKLAQLEKDLKASIATYIEKVEQERTNAQAIIDEQARKTRADADAKAAKIAADAETAAQELRDKAAAALAAGNVGKAAQLEIQAESKVEAAGARIATLVTNAENLAPAVVLPSMDKAKGQSFRYDYSAELDPAPGAFLLFLGWLILNPAYIKSCITTVHAGLKALASLQKEEFSVPGLRLVKKPVVSSRAA